mgnify:CR=1 FL=1
MPPSFTSPPNPVTFQNQVWEIVRKIPSGKVATYGQIAGLVPVPVVLTLDDYRAFGARWVGGAMAACPPNVPWQRVINAQGKISFRRGRGESSNGKPLCFAVGLAEPSWQGLGDKSYRPGTMRFLLGFCSYRSHRSSREPLL